MADFKSIKRRRTLGAPPSLDEASSNLQAPEVAPAPQIAPPNPAPLHAEPDPPQASASRVDGRSLRRTGRTVPFASRVTPAFDAQLRHAAQRDGLGLVEVLEKALALYEAARDK